MKTKAGLETFSMFFTGLCELFDKRYSEALLGIYVNALSGYAIGDVAKAISHAATSCTFFPKPSELIELLGGGALRADEIGLIEAGKVLRAIKQVGSYRSVKFDDPVTTAVISTHFGGWVKMCQDLKADADKWFLKDFEKAYVAYSRHGIKENAALPGVIETDNSAKGFEFHENVIQIASLRKKAVETHRQDDVAVIGKSIKALLKPIGRSADGHKKANSGI